MPLDYREIYNIYLTATQRVSIFIFDKLKGLWYVLFGDIKWVLVSTVHINELKNSRNSFFFFSF